MPSPRSAAASTGSRWESRSRHRGWRSSPRATSPIGSVAAWTCRAQDHATHPSGSGRCRPPSPGATTSCAIPSGGCSSGCRSSPAASACPKPRPSAGPPEELGVDVLDGISTLVDHSLVQPAPSTLGARFRLLSTMRMFAADRLEQRGDAESHPRAAMPGPTSQSPRRSPRTSRDLARHRRLDRLAEEHDNFRAAFDWAIDRRRGRARAASRRRAVAVLAGARTSRGGLGDRPARPRDARRRCAHAGRLGLLDAAGGVAWWRGDIADRRPLLRGAGRPGAPHSASRGRSRTRCSTSATRGSSAATRPPAKRSAPRRSACTRQIGDARGAARVGWIAANVLTVTDPAAATDAAGGPAGTVRRARRRLLRRDGERHAVVEPARDRATYDAALEPRIPVLPARCARRGTSAAATFGIREVEIVLPPARSLPRRQRSSKAPSRLCATATGSARRRRSPSMHGGCGPVRRLSATSWATDEFEALRERRRRDDARRGRGADRGDARRGTASETGIRAPARVIDSPAMERQPRLPWSTPASPARSPRTPCSPRSATSTGRAVAQLPRRVRGARGRAGHRGRRRTDRERGQRHRPRELRPAARARARDRRRGRRPGPAEPRGAARPGPRRDRAGLLAHPGAGPGRGVPADAAVAAPHDLQHRGRRQIHRRAGRTGSGGRALAAGRSPVRTRDPRGRHPGRRGQPDAVPHPCAARRGPPRAPRRRPAADHARPRGPQRAGHAPRGARGVRAPRPEHEQARVPAEPRTRLGVRLLGRPRRGWRRTPRRRQHSPSSAASRRCCASSAATRAARAADTLAPRQRRLDR